MRIEFALNASTAATSRLNELEDTLEHLARSQSICYAFLLYACCFHVISCTWHALLCKGVVMILGTNGVDPCSAYSITNVHSPFFHRIEPPFVLTKRDQTASVLRLVLLI